MERSRIENTMDKSWMWIVVVLSFLSTQVFQTDAAFSKDVSIYSMHMITNIQYRYATTRVTSQLANRAPDATEVTFGMTMPTTAFITNFTMIIDGTIIHGEVKEKEKAKKEYEQAKKRGESTGLVAAKTRETNRYQVSVNVAGKSKVKFILIYQELLTRRLGYYSSQIYLEPGRIIPDFRVDIYIDESRPISYLRVPAVRRSVTESINSLEDNPSATVRYLSKKSAHVAYYPTVKEQESFNADKGVSGEFFVLYDVDRSLDAGDIEVIDGYFVHFISPTGLKPMPKNIVFILDESGSMGGSKIKQLKKAMNKILDDLHPKDLFQIVTFESTVSFWRDSAWNEATLDNVEAAKLTIRQIRPSGGTNINAAFEESLRFINRTKGNDVNKATIIVFLTDGQATSGVTNPQAILDNVKILNTDEISIFSLAFGVGADFNLIQQLSLQNNGFGRKIYEGADAALQLTGFYDEISTPLLHNVTIKYLDNSVNETSLTKSSYTNYFNGSEMVVAGKLTENTLTNNMLFRAEVNGEGLDGNVDLSKDVQLAKNSSGDDIGRARNFIERLWAYLTIRDLLDNMIETRDEEQKKAIKQRVIDMSVKYHFVTPVTSMVVVLPQTPDVAIQENPKTGQESGASGGKNSLASNPSKPSGGSRSQSSSKPRGSSGRTSSHSSADMDPHFIIQIGGLKKAVCFDVMGEPMDIFNLFHDHATGVVINGQVIPSAPRKDGKETTYFGTIAVMAKAVTMIFTPQSIIIDKKYYDWGKNRTMIKDADVQLKITKKKVIIRLDKHLSFIIIRHLVNKVKNPLKVDFLGIYVEDQVVLSPSVHGLIGQFEFQAASVVQDNNNKTFLRFDVPRVYKAPVWVTEGQRKNHATKQLIPCWQVANNGDGFIDGHYTDYKVDKLTYRRLPQHLRKYRNPVRLVLRRIQRQKFRQRFRAVAN